jgi:hypothetical protein
MWEHFLALPYWQMALIGLAIVILIGLIVWAIIDLKRYLHHKKHGNSHHKDRHHK